MTDDELVDRLNMLEERLDSLSHLAGSNDEEIEDLRNEFEEFRHDVEQELQEVRRSMEAVQEQADMMQRIKRASALKPDERAAVLIQTLYAQAKRNGERPNHEPRATMEAGEAVHALGGDADRTNMYGESGIFNRAVELVDDQDVLWYQKESRASKQNSRLIMDLGAGEPPATVAGYDIAEGD